MIGVGDRGERRQPARLRGRRSSEAGVAQKLVRPRGRRSSEAGDVFDGVGQFLDRLDGVFAHVADAERLLAEL